MPPASEIRENMSFKHVLNPTEPGNGADVPYPTAGQHNEDTSQDENLHSQVPDEMEVDNTDEYISEVEREGADSDLENSDSSSNALFDTQTTVFSDQGDYKDNHSQSRQDKSRTPLRERLLRRSASFVQGDNGRLENSAPKTSMSRMEHPNKYESARDTVDHELDENREEDKFEVGEGGDDKDDNGFETKMSARRYGRSGPLLSVQTPKPSQPRSNVLPHEGSGALAITQEDDCEMVDDNASPEQHSSNEDAGRFALPSPSSYQRIPQIEGGSQYKLSSSVQVDNPTIALVQQSYTSRPAALPEQASRSNETGANVQNPSEGFFYNLRPDWSHAKRRRNSPHPEPGEEAGPTSRKHPRLSHDDSGREDHVIPRTAGAEGCSIEGSERPNIRQKLSGQRLVKPQTKSPGLGLSPSKSKNYTHHQSTSPARPPGLRSPCERGNRTRYTPSLPPPSPKINERSFNIFIALLAYPDLVLEVSKHLEVVNLVNLYAMSRAYHVLVDDRFTALIMSQAIGRASESARTFNFRAYRNLCKRDPAGRIMLFSVSEKEGIERVATANDNDVRFVPSFRWLKMILHHEAVVDRILYHLAQEGHRLPKPTTLMLKKLWFTLDITDNGRRIGLLHDTRFWSSKELFLATMFFMKLDMRLTDPATGDGEMGLRQMLLAQKSMETLARVLAREELTSQLELVRLIVKFDYSPPRPLLEGETVFGIPAEQVGKLSLEGWGKGESKLVPIDELIGREAVRRKLNLQNHYVDMMLYGYIDKRTFQDVRTPMNLISRTDGEDEEDTETETSSEDTEGEYDEESRLVNERIERMELFEGDADMDLEEGGEGDSQEQEQENSRDEQGLDITEDEMRD